MRIDELIIGEDKTVLDAMHPVSYTHLVPLFFRMFCARRAARRRAAGIKYFYNYKGGRLFCKGKAACARPEKAARRAPFG